MQCLKRRPPILARAAFFLSLLALALPGRAYGPFKQKTLDFKWAILKSPHFDIYFYPEEEALARRAAAIAERALAHDSKVLDYYPKTRQPLFLFQSHIDFQQTNIAQEVIGPGTGGFTEAYKNRMVLPTTQSDKWLDIVIAHELTHAIQFDLLYGEGQRSFQVFKNYIIPLWVMEGMAEYCAKNWDSYADMVMRDAVLNERVPDLDQMDGFSHLDEVYVAYKAGQSAIQYLSDTYGPESVNHLLRKYKAQISTGQIIKELTGKSAGAFNREWKASLRQKYWLQAQGKKSAADYGQALTWEDSENLTTNNGPAWSPDGKQIAYLSTATQREEVWVMDADGKHAHSLFGGPFEEMGRSGGYGVPGTIFSWSPDGKSLAFVAVRDGSKHLFLADIASGRLSELTLPYREIAAPAFSPDGQRLAFSAAISGVSQLYTVSLAAHEVVQLTHETTTSLVTDPAWSPDGASLVYSAEDERVNQVFRIQADGSGRKRLSKAGVDSLMPVYSPDGKTVFYCTEEGGGYNLARVDPDGGSYDRFTNLVNGAFYPRPSPDGRYLAFVAYEDGCQNLYRMDAPGWVKAAPSAGLQALIDPYRFAAAPASPSAATLLSPSAEAPALSMTAEGLPLPPAASLGLSPSALALPETALPEAPAEEVSPLTDTAALPVEPYRSHITPDLFFLLLGYDSLNGLVGGGYITASDMLGNHNLSAYANFVPGYESILQADYTLLKGPKSSLSFSLFYRDSNFFLANLNPQEVNSTFLDEEYGASFVWDRPLSKFAKVDLSVGARHLFRQEEGDAVLDPLVATTLGESFINSVGLSVTRDTFTYKNYDTYGGYRVSLATNYSDKVLGGTRNFVYDQAEVRVGVPLSFLSRDTVLSGRLLGMVQTGQDRQIFYFGGAQVRGLSYNEYLGEMLGLGNLQIRTPYFKRLNGSLWPLQSLLIRDVQMVGFYDVGVAPNDWRELQGTDVRAGYGGGIRLHCFMFEKAFVLFAFDVAQRTDKPGTTYYYFTLGQIF
jgi:Tol biopolymer transport system component